MSAELSAKAADERRKELLEGAARWRFARRSQGRSAKNLWVEGDVEDVFTTYLIVTAITIVATGAIAIAGVRRAGFVVNNMAEVGVPESWLVPLAALKAAGAAGLLLGILGVVLSVPILLGLGIVAAAGLVLFFTGALLTHLRARVFHNLHFPGTFWLLATASLAGALAQ